MKYKVTIYDDDNEIIGNRNLEVESEGYAYDEVGQAAEDLADKHHALDECEDCGKKLMYFDEQLPHNHVCTKCVKNSPAWQEKLIPSNEL